MKNLKPLNFVFAVLAIGLGITIYKEFDFENREFKHTALAILYIVTFLVSILFLVKDYTKRPEK